MSEWSFKDEISLKKINLARAALQFARHIAYPTLNVKTQIDLIKQLGDEASCLIQPNAPIEYQATQLSEFLFQQKRFSGNREAYYDVRNSFLNDVLQRKQGIPISLSVLFIVIAEQLNLKAYGVGLPGHFIVMVPNQHQRLFFDPFHGGGRLSINDCANLVQQTTGYEGSFEPHWLDPVDEKLILNRMLANLRNNYIQVEQWQEAIKTLECLQQLNPNDMSIVRDLGVLLYQQGDIYQAVNLLDEYGKKDPEASDLPYIKKGIAQRLDEWVRLN